MTNYDVVKKLIGNVRPQADSRIDEIALENLKEMCELTEQLLGEIDMALCQRFNAKEYSVLQVQKYAKEFLNKVGYRNDK